MLPSLLLVLLLALLLGVGQSFAPASARAFVVPPPRTLPLPLPLPRTDAGWYLGMASDSDEPDAASSTETKEAPKEGTFYDDEVNPIPESKQGISADMKQRLKAEATQGLDPDKKQANVLLYIMAFVAVLVIAGGQGIFF